MRHGPFVIASNFSGEASTKRLLLLIVGGRQAAEKTVELHRRRAASTLQHLAAPKRLKAEPAPRLQGNHILLGRCCLQGTWGIVSQADGPAASTRAFSVLWAANWRALACVEPCRLPQASCDDLRLGCCGYHGSLPVLPTERLHLCLKPPKKRAAQGPSYACSTSRCCFRRPEWTCLGPHCTLAVSEPSPKKPLKRVCAAAVQVLEAVVQRVAVLAPARELPCIAILSAPPEMQGGRKRLRQAGTAGLCFLEPEVFGQSVHSHFFWQVKDT